ncbi:MAG TPA: efflux transporter outer membrane subunit [Caulobacteraceae bacterium]|nr:efflux transporter outer membrane subunit [Caulobacteraceae bacterium]
MTALLCACTVGPDYHRPQIASPSNWSETAGLTTSSDEAQLARWWGQFSDPVLDGLIARALKTNLDLETAASRVRQARFQESEAKAAQWPSIKAMGDAATLNSNRTSGGASSGASGSGGAPAGAGFALPSHLNLYSAGFDASWEIDIFGGVRRSIEEAKANSEAAVWARRDAEVTLTAEIASDYFALRQIQARLALGRGELARQNEIGALVGARHRAGFVTNFDVNQQTGVITSAAAQLHQLEGEERVQIHALAILVAEPPESLEPELTQPRALPVSPPSLPVGLPSDLIRRRPDVREAERRLAAANAEIGVQTANLYPKLDLIGLASFASTSLGNLFSTANLTSAALGMASEPLFDAGKTRAAIRAAREGAVQADLTWRKTVLVSFRDVEDALARYRSEQERQLQLTQAVGATQNSLAIARDQYQVGLVTFANVYSAELAEMNARDQLVQSQAAAATDLVSLYKALGGGWSVWVQAGGTPARP